MDSLDAMAAKADAAQFKAQQRASKKPELTPMASVVGREDGVLLVNRGGVIQPATNNTTAGLGVGEVIAQGEGTYLEVMSPEPFQPQFPVVPMVVQRRRLGREAILPFIYSTDFVSSVQALENGTPVTKELDGNVLWLHTRDRTVEEIPPSVFFWEIKSKGYKTLGDKQGNSRFDTELLTGFSNGGCDGSTYQSYTYTVTFPEGEPGEIYITEDVEFIPHRLKLAPGDTSVRYRETGGHGGGGSSLDAAFYRTQAEAARFDSNYIQVSPSSGFRQTQLALYSYLWTLTSWPSEEYSISGTGLKLASGQNFATRLQASGSLPFCGGDTFTASADPFGHSPAFSETGSAIIPIVPKLDPGESYLSSGEQREYMYLCFEFNPQITQGNDPFVGAATQQELRTISLPSNVTQTLVSGSISIGMFSANGQDSGVSTPSLLIPAKSCNYSTYERDLEAEPITAEIRDITQDDLDLDGWNDDWRYPLQLDPVIWDSPCSEQYADQPFANISSSLFQAQSAPLQTVISSPIDSSVTAGFTSSPLSQANGECVTGTSAEKTISLAGLGVDEETPVLFAAPNIIPRKYGRKNIE